jgi:multiple sugar transport system permease protein
LTLSSRSPDLDEIGRASLKPTGDIRPVRQVRRRRRLSAAPYLFLAPGFLLFAVAILYPIARALQISLYDWKIMPGAQSQFVGLDQYRRQFSDPVFWTALTNSAFYMAFTVPLQIVFGLAIAVLLDAKIPGRGLFRTLFYLPVVTSWVVVALLFKFLFATDDGFVNWFLQAVHLSGGNIGWLDSRWPAMVTVGLLGVWKGVGWSMLIFLAALQGVSKDLKEAAAVDGAGAWRSFRSVTLPAIRLAIGFVTVMLVIGGLNVFQSVYIVTAGGPMQSTEVVLTYMYQQAFGNIDFGYGSAMAFSLALIVFVVSFVQMRAFRGGARRVER